MMQTRFAEIVFRGRNRNSGDAYNLRLSVADPDHLANGLAEQGPGQRRDMGDRPLPRIGFVLADDKGQPMQDQATAVSLKSRIEQMLTEARVIIPGAQALLGFQLIAVLTRAFNELPSAFKYVHCIGLSAVTLSVILLMTPAALHRIGFRGEDDPAFFALGSRFVVAGSVPLAVGIAAAVAVVFFQAVGSESAAVAAGLVSLLALLGFWLGYPFWRPSRSRTATNQK